MTGGHIGLHQLAKAFDGVPAVTGIDLDIPAGQFYSLLGASGCGKTTTLRMIAGFEKPDSGPHRARRPRRRRRSAAPSPGQHRLPDLRAVPVHVGVGQRRVRAEVPEVIQGGDQAPRRRGARPGADGQVRQAQTRPAVGRAAAAGRPGAGAGAAPAGAAARRAARRAGCQAAQAVTARVAGGAARGRDHVRLRDARPGGSAHDERPDRGARRRPGRAGRARRRRSTRRRRRPSSRASSARPTSSTPRCSKSPGRRRSARRSQTRLGAVVDHSVPEGARPPSSSGRSASPCRLPTSRSGRAATRSAERCAQVVYLGASTQVHVDVGRRRRWSSRCPTHPARRR